MPRRLILTMTPLEFRQFPVQVGRTLGCHVRLAVDISFCSNNNAADLHLGSDGASCECRFNRAGKISLCDQGGAAAHGLEIPASMSSATPSGPDALPWLSRQSAFRTVSR